MLKPVVFANAFTLVSLGLYIGCRVLSFVIPDLLFTVGQSWFHTFKVETIRGGAPMDVGTFLLGGITFGVLTWITFYTGAYLYNRLSR